MANVVILCARNSSTRLPGKALVEVAGKPMIQHIIERYQACKRVDRVILAVPEGDSLADLGLPGLFAGDMDNVVKRMDDALKCHAPDATAIFRGLGDMPLFDIGLLDWRFDLMERTGSDLCWVGQRDDPLPVYGSRESPWSRRAWDAIVENSRGNDLEHAGQWLYHNLRQFHVYHTDTLPKEYYQSCRLELDTPDDLRFFRMVYDALYHGPGTPSTMAVLRYLQNCPGVAAINAQVATKTLTVWNFKRRGAEWVCKECGSPAMETGLVQKRDDYNVLETHCAHCGAMRTFHPVPSFLARKRRL